MDGNGLNALHLPKVLLVCIDYFKCTLSLKFLLHKMTLDDMNKPNLNMITVECWTLIFRNEHRTLQALRYILNLISSSYYDLGKCNNSTTKLILFCTT
jgi:hypothetical protein